jgi:hypothetical protein
MIQAMLNPFGRRIIALIVALGVCLSGALPSLAAPHAADSVPCSMMMPDMPMPANSTVAQKHTPMKSMPCDGTRCGCCLAGTCAMPAGLMPTASVSALYQFGEISFLEESLDGISHRPGLPPPILYT